MAEEQPPYPGGPSALDDTSSRTDDLRIRVPAIARRLPSLRQALGDWATHAGVAPADREALVLACYEAMANTVVHAYDGRPGVLDICAIRQPDNQSVEVTITDYGRWRPPSDGGPLHGRGLPIMYNLAVDTAIEAGDNGTTVRMRWHLQDGDPVTSGLGSGGS